jgi:alpha-tubulin suppressor-like RCC1 family protein
MSTTSASHSIWHAARRGDELYVREYVTQEEKRREQEEMGGEEGRRTGTGGTTASSKKRLTSSTSGASSTSFHLRGKLAAAFPLGVDPASGVTGRNRDGQTALHVASIYQHRHLLSLLSSSPASIDVPDIESQWTALHHALYRGDFMTAQVLRRANAGFSQEDEEGMTPLDLVTSHQMESVRRREDNGAGRTGTKGKRFIAPTDSALQADQSGFAVLSKSAQSSSALPPHHLLFSYGYQTNYTLGFSCDHFQFRPKRIESVVGESIVQVVTGKQAVFMLAASGSVFSHGQGASGKLGHDARETLIEPKRIAALSDIAFIAGTDEYTCAVSEKGAVFIFGYSAFIDSVSSVPAAKGAAAAASASSSSRLHSGSHSPPPSSRTLSSTSDSSFAPGSLRYSQLPRRLDALRSLAVAQVFPSERRLLLLTQQGELWYLGSAIEDMERWESTPKRFAAPIESPLVQVQNSDEFVAILTQGVIRIQRRGERKLNKLWLQNYVDTPLPRDSASQKSIRDLFPLIPKAYVVRMAWSSDGRRGAAVTREGQVFLWKLPEGKQKTMPSLSSFPPSSAPPSSSTSFSAPRCIGYLLEGLAHTRATDVSCAASHTVILTEEGHVYTTGPGALGVTRPGEEKEMKGVKRLTHFSHVSRIYCADQYCMASVAIKQVDVRHSFPELEGLFDVPSSKRVALPVAVPSLKLMCERHLAQQITPVSLVAAYEWSVNTGADHLVHYCTSSLLLNLPYYLPFLLSLSDPGCLEPLQQAYRKEYPIWFYAPQWTQPLQEAVRGEELAVPSILVPISSPPDDVESELFSFSNALAQLKIKERKAAQPRTAEERVNEIKLRRRALTKKLTQIASLSGVRYLDTEQREKIALRGKYEEEVTALDKELEGLRDQGSLSAAKLWDKLRGIGEAEEAEEERQQEKAPKRAAVESKVPTSATAATQSTAATASSSSVAPTPGTSTPSAVCAAPNEAPSAVAAAIPDSTPSSSSSSRISSDLLSRPVRALNKAAEPSVPVAVKEIGKGKGKSIPVATTAAAVSRPPIPATTPTRPPPSIPPPSVAPPPSSFAAIQAEEARIAEASAKMEQAKRGSMRPATASSTASIVPQGGKGWGGAASVTSPVITSAAMGTPRTGSAASGAGDFPSLSLAQSPSFKPSKPVTSSPPLRAISSSGSAPATVFSLADFMPALATKAKPVPVPVKGWNVPAAPVAVETTTVAVNTPSKKKGGGKLCTPALPSPPPPTVAVGSPPLHPVAAPVSLLSIQQAEALRCYGPSSSFKTQRQLDHELELAQAATGGKTAWNTTHASANQIAVREVQEQEEKAIQDAAEKERKRLEKIAKKKAKIAAAKARDAEAALLAPALTASAADLPAGASSSNLTPAPAHPNPKRHTSNGQPKQPKQPKQKQPPQPHSGTSEQQQAQPPKERLLRPKQPKGSKHPQAASTPAAPRALATQA